MAKTLDGAECIAAERARQIADEGWTPEHDDEHADGSLAMAAVCYATPALLYEKQDRYVNRTIFVDPWPWQSDAPRWDGNGDKRYCYGSCRDNPGNVLPDPSTYTPAERLDLLVKAGALIAAEIDRLLRVKPIKAAAP